jgi:hypothetical protein
MKKLTVNPGERFHSLTVEEMKGVNEKGFSIASCRCDCGNPEPVIVKVAELISGHRKTCGCQSWESKAAEKSKDIIGKRFNRAVVESFAGKDNKNYRLVWCKCDCGTRFKARIAHLLSGLVQSCGCLQKEKATANLALVHQRQVKHGLSGTLTGRSWQAMMQRCFSPRNENFREYGGAGITACAFLKASPLNLILVIGERPNAGMSLDRWPNNEGHYSCGTCEECLKNGWPLNIRWATQSEQCLNRSNNRMIEIDGVIKAASEWCKFFGLPRTSKQFYTYPKDDKPFEVECSCQCPNWGKKHDDVWKMKADGCGHEFNACGLCLREGRLTDCRVCGGGHTE